MERDDMPLRVAIDGRALRDRHAGVGRYVWNLVRALARVADGEEFVFLESAKDGNSRFPLESFDEIGVRRVAVAQPLSGLSQQFALPPRLRRLEVDVFHAPHHLTAYHPPCPLVVTVTGAVAARSSDFEPSARSRWLYRTSLRLALRSSRGVVTLSKASKDELVERFAVESERVRVIPAAADSDLEPAASETVEALRERRRLPPRYALCLGSNRPHKNLVRLVEAWAAVREKAAPEAGKTRCHLVFAGRFEPRFPEARERARELGLDEVRFLGAVEEDELAALLSGAELLVLPSLHEGFALPVVEAMACGTAVACARTSSLPAVAGAAAVYFDPLDSASIASTVARLLTNSAYRRMLAERGQRQAAQFSWESAARKTLALYREVASATSTQTRR